MFNTKNFCKNCPLKEVAYSADKLSIDLNS